MPTVLLPLLLQIVLIALNAVFACAEIAVITLNDARLSRLASAGDKRALRLSRLTSQPARFLATIQVAITLSGFLGSAFAADNFSDPIVAALVRAGATVPAATLNTISVIVITLILSYFTLVFGELVPKRLAMKNAEKLALGMSNLISFISKVFAPLVWLLTVSTNGVLRLCGMDPNAEDEEATEENIRMMVDVGSEKGTIDHAEREMIQNVFEFDDITAGEILTHRTQVDILYLEESDEEWFKTIRENRHSHYPVCDETADDVIGILDARDYFRLDDRSRAAVMKKAVSPARFVPDTAKADALFFDMKKSRNHFAVVLDEYGGMSGIVTMNDLLEEIVGDLPDEDDEALPFIEQLDARTWRMDGYVSVDDIEDLLGTHVPEGDYDTLNGLVLSRLSAFPEEGARFTVRTGSLIIAVEEFKNRRVQRALLRLAPTDQA